MMVSMPSIHEGYLSKRLRSLLFWVVIAAVKICRGHAVQQMNPPGVHKANGLERIGCGELVIWKLCPSPFVVGFDAGVFFGEGMFKPK
jgi:hypothetical protein